MLAFGLFHRSATDTVVEGCGRNSAGSMFFELSSDSSRPGSYIVAELIDRSSMLDPNLWLEGPLVLTGVSVTVLVDDMIVQCCGCIHKMFAELERNEDEVRSL
jgi:hypothetical protein